MGFYGRKLIRRLQDEYGMKFPDDIRISPYHPGWATRSAGGFIWTFWSMDNITFNNIGSQHTVRECAMAKSISVNVNGWGDVFIDINSDTVPIKE